MKGCRWRLASEEERMSEGSTANRQPSRLNAICVTFSGHTSEGGKRSGSSCFLLTGLFQLLQLAEDAKELSVGAVAVAVPVQTGGNGGIGEDHCRGM